jgi:hypothetical protein
MVQAGKTLVPSLEIFQTDEASAVRQIAVPRGSGVSDACAWFLAISSHLARSSPKASPEEEGQDDWIFELAPLDETQVGLLTVYHGVADPSAVLAALRFRDELGPSYVSRSPHRIPIARLAAAQAALAQRG